MDLDQLIRLVHASDAVALLGAGLSYDAGMPLANELHPLVWKTFDDHPDQRALLSNEFGLVDLPGAELIGIDATRIARAFRSIAEQAVLRNTFQASFQALNHTRSAVRSLVHDAVARLIYNGKIELAISLNWDSLLESAYKRRYGPAINVPLQRLYKPHGDVLDPTTAWTLPVEQVRMPNQLMDRLDAMVRERPRILLVVGYREADETVVKQIVQPLEQRWQVVRISLSAHGHTAFAARAGDVLPPLSERLCRSPEHPGWEFVTFFEQRDLGPAIAGERLGPADVAACPRLPHVDALAKQLAQSHVGRMEGSAGSGKSISAYQAAHDQFANGFHILRLAEPPVLDTAVESFLDYRGRSVFLVDDAQRYPSGFLRTLQENATSERKLLLIGTELQAGSQSVRLTAEESVEAVAGAFKRRREEVLQHVQSHDPDMGNRYMDRDLDQRIETAAKEKNLWLFNFVLRGGWRQAKRSLSEYRDLDRADLLLVGTAALQRLGLDAPITYQQLSAIAQAFNRGQVWLDNVLPLLLARRQLIEDRGGYRCVHLAYTYELLEHFSKQRPGEEHKQFYDFVRNAMVNEYALRGVTWLLSPIKYSGSCYAKGYGLQILDSELGESLLRRCLMAESQEERSDAAIVIDEVLYYIDIKHSRLKPHIAHLAKWVNESDGTADHGFSWLINNTYNDDKELAKDFVDQIDLVRLIDRVATAQPGKSYGFGSLVDRVHVAVSIEKRELLADLITKSPLEEFAARYKQIHFWELMAVANDFAATARSAGDRFITGAASVIDAAFASDAIEAFINSRDFVYGALGWISEILGSGRMKLSQRNLGRKLVRAIDPRRLAGQVVDSRPRRWEEVSGVLAWLSRVDKEKLQSVIENVDLNAVRDAVGANWAEPGRELRLLISALHDGQRQDRRITKWIIENRESLRQIDPLFLGAAPELAEFAIERGIPIDLHGHNGRNWGAAFRALLIVHKLNPLVARKLVPAERALIVSTLSKPEGIDENVGVFVRFAAEVDPEMVRDILSTIDLEVASEAWKKVSELEGFRRSVKHLAQTFEILSLNVPAGFRKVDVGVNDEQPSDSD